MTNRPRTLLGWILGSDETAYKLIQHLGLEKPLLRIIHLIDRIAKRLRP